MCNVVRQQVFARGLRIQRLRGATPFVGHCDGRLELADLRFHVGIIYLSYPVEGKAESPLQWRFVLKANEVHRSKCCAVTTNNKRFFISKHGCRN